MKRVLVIGGSDSGAGAGIQADLKTIHTLGVHASTVVTAVTAQNTLGVDAIHEVPPAIVTAQILAVLGDIGADVVKTGMLASAGAVQAVIDSVADLPLVVDPVGVSSSGQSLLSPEALVLLRSGLLPLAQVVTPNLAEVEALTGVVVRDAGDLLTAAKAVHALGPRWVLVTGGHLPGPPVDLLYNGSDVLEIGGPRLESPHTHGTGCTLASALAAYLARGDDVPEAAARAKRFVAEAIRNGYALGKGPGPVRQA